MIPMDKDTAKKYNSIKLRITLIEIFVSILFWIIFLATRLNFSFARAAESAFTATLPRFYFFVLLITLLNMLITFPLSLYSGYFLEKKFKLSNHTLLSWFWEQFKGLFVGLLLGLVVLTGFYLILLKFPRFWWFGVWLFFLVFGILLSKIGPILIFPLFYKFKPVENQELVNQLKTFATQWKFQLSGIFQFNLSKTTKKANAAFTGMGKSRRIILGDTLLEKFTIPEIETVFAHEIGHYIHKHLVKGIVLNSLLSLAGLFVIFKIYSDITVTNGLHPYQLPALPYLALLLLLYGLVTGPIGNYVSRKFEYQADHFAVESTRNAEAFQNSLLKLSQLNLADETPNPLVEFLFHSHPSIHHRLEKINGELI